MRYSKILTTDRLRELLYYDPGSGSFRWKVRKSPRVKIGDIAGVVLSAGYRKIRIDSKLYGANRLAWLYMTGEWPTCVVDHANRDPDDNRWCNLRNATFAQNGANSRTYRPQGKGSYFDRRKNVWYSMISKNGKTTYLGTFHTEKEARNRYLAEAKKVFGEFARA